MEKANKRIAILEHDLAKLEKEKQQRKADDSDSDDDDDDLDDTEGIKVELAELKAQNEKRQAKLDEFEKNKKWNIDNMFHVKEERTVVNPSGGDLTYTPTGYVKPKEEVEAKKQQASPEKVEEKKVQAAKPKAEPSKPAAAAKPSTTVATKKDSPAKTTTTSSGKKPGPSLKDVGAMETYHEFTEKYADLVEDFMKIPDIEGSRVFLLQHADILLQENASNYLLLASLEDEMNGHHEKMKRTARQSQIITNIVELAKTVSTHPGNVIEPFFARLRQREHFEEFMLGVNAFCDKIVKRAVTKRQEMDEQRRRQEAEEAGEGNTTTTDLASVPREERLGPGGLDPLEVIETLPEDMVKAFESRDVEQLKQALMKLSPEDAERHMKRCVDSGLWVA